MPVASRLISMPDIYSSYQLFVTIAHLLICSSAHLLICSSAHLPNQLQACGCPTGPLLIGPPGTGCLVGTLGRPSGPMGLSDCWQPNNVTRQVIIIIPAKICFINHVLSSGNQALLPKRSLFIVELSTQKSCHLVGNDSSVLTHQAEVSRTHFIKVIIPDYRSGGRGNRCCDYPAR